jgi:hypothetical protein
MAACKTLFLILALGGEHILGARIQPNNAMTKRKQASSLAEADAGKAAPRQYKRVHAKSEQHDLKKGAAQENHEASSSATSFIQSEASESLVSKLAKIPKNNSSERLLLGLAVLAFVVLVMLGAFCFGSCCLKEGKDKKDMRNDLLTSPPSSTGTSSSKTPSWVASFEESEYPREKHTHEGRVVYEWSQNEDMACVFIKVPEGTNRHDLDIRISTRHLQVGKKGKPAFMTEETYAAVDKDQSGWRLRSSGELQVHLAKSEPGTWPYVLLVKNQDQDS